MPKQLMTLPLEYDELTEQDDLFSEKAATNRKVTGTESPTIADGYLVDAVSGEKLLKETPKELVRQRVVRALHQGDGIAYEDMVLDFSTRIDGKRRKIDVAIFHPDQPHAIENLSRVVVCRPEPTVGRNVVIRDHDQAKKDLDELETLMAGIDACRYGLWTNGLDFFYLEKRTTAFETTFEPIGYWPVGGESFGLQETPSRAFVRRADKEMLKTAFRRCHNFIHGNEGMPKDAAFWQFLYLIFCKIHDEQSPRTEQRFWIGAKEQFDPAKRRDVRRRILDLFKEVKDRYQGVFRGNEEITLSDRALAFMVSELSRYDLRRTDVDAKGTAYQEIVGNNLRGDRGQYFTPRGVVELAVKMLAPKEHERVLDPACGTGGFLNATLAYMLSQFRDEQQNAKTQQNATKNGDKGESTEEFYVVAERLSDYAQEHIFGADFDPFLIKASQMNMVMSGDGRTHLYNINSLEFPHGHLADVGRAKQECKLGSIDVLMTNPPFGADIPIVDRYILEQYELARYWEPTGDGNFRNTGNLQPKLSPEVLFIERCLEWLVPGGRMAIVLPNGILGNPSAEYIRWWILQKAWVLASVDLPVEVFIVDANVNILTSLLVLKKKTDQESHAESLGGRVEYPIFMAVAEKVGFDRRGNTLYRRNPDGTDIIETKLAIEQTIRNGKTVERKVKRTERIVDDDLPIIAGEYRQFLAREAKQHPHLLGL
jgi:type I restriction enzyme M protein